MAIEIVKEEESIKIFGYVYHSDGTVNKSCKVTIYFVGAGITIDHTTTDKYGYFEFNLNKSSLSVGQYQVRYYGTEYREELMPDGDWEPFEITADILFDITTARCNDVSDMAMEVQENAIENKSGTVSNAEINLSNIDLIAGKITDIIVEHKLSSEGTWKNAGSFSVDWSGYDNSGTFVLPNMTWNEDGIDHDFRLYFLNSVGEKAVQDSDDAVIGGDAGYLQDLNVTFNGYSDIDEYASVIGLDILNASTGEAGTFVAPYLLPLNGIARLEWDDMTQKGTINNHPLANGSTATITPSMWKNLSGYFVWMYLSSTAAPANEYPDPDEPNGNWYLVLETKSNSAEIDVPKDKVIAFYVGCKMRLAVPGGSSTPTTRLGYTQYREGYY